MSIDDARARLKRMQEQVAGEQAQVQRSNEVAPPKETAADTANTAKSRLQRMQEQVASEQPELGSLRTVVPTKEIRSDTVEASPGLIERAAQGVVDFGASAARGAKDLVTGESRTEFPDIPELPSKMRTAIVPGVGQIGAKMSLGRDDLRKTDIFRQFFPNTPAELDRFGNAIVDLDENIAKQYGIKKGKYYLNKPGASPQDFDDFMTTALFEISGASGGAGLGKLAAGKAGKVVGAGLGAGGGSVLQDLAAGAAGSERGIDLISALVATGFGIGGELAGEVVAPFFRKFLQDKRFITNKGLTPAGREALTNAGLDPEAVTPEFIQEFQNVSRGAVSAEQAARVSAAQSLPQPVVLTQGDVARTRAAQSAEDALLASGDKTLSNIRAQQSEQLAENIPLIAEEIAPTGAVAASPGDAMVDVTSELARKRSATKAKVDRLYGIARKRGAKNLLTSSEISPQIATIKNNLAEDFLPENFPKTQNLVKNLESLIKKKEKVSVTELESWRQRATKLTKSPEEGAAARALIQEYDGFVDNLLDDIVTAGDADAFKPWMLARQRNKNFKERFGDDAIIEKLSDPDSLLEPSEAFNLLTTVTGAAKGSTSTVKKLKKELSPEGFNRLRQGYFLRLAEQAQKNVPGEGGVPSFSGAAFKSAHEKFKKRSPELYNVLFTKEHQKLLNQFATVAELATTAVPGAKNLSGTAAPILRNLQQLFGTPATIALERVTAPLVGQARTGSAAIRARGSVDKKELLPGFAGGLGATAGQSEIGDPRRVTSAREIERLRALAGSVPSTQDLIRRGVN